MKKKYIILSFVLTFASLNAQNKNTQKADKLFNQYEYVDAAQEYLKLEEQGKADNYVNLQLATTYFNMFDTVNAEKWYAVAVQTPQEAETYYRYAQMLKANGKYEQANKQMQEFAKLAPQDQRAIAFKENPNYIPKLKADPKLFDVTPSSVSSEKSDFGAVLYGNILYFTSARNLSAKKYGWNEEPFLDIYKADFNGDGTITNATAVTDLNTTNHDGPLTMTQDGNTVYFASNSFRASSFEKDKKNNLKLGRNNIYKATKDGDKWTNITSLPFNSKEYSTSSPSVSRDGKTLYFSSDMPGTLGDVDIWKVAVNEDGSYGTPENLGKNVNTEGKESFPFINDDNNTLYFASSGRQGFGGLDVFQVDLSKNEKASNIGQPVNTEKDDFALSLNQEKNIGFLSSNRNGVDNIYTAIPVCSVEIITKVTDAKTGAPLANATVAIEKKKKNVITKEMSNENGEVVYRVDCNKDFVIQASKDGYESNSFPVAKSKERKANINAALAPIDVIVTEKEIILKPILFEYNKSNITQDAAFELDKLVQVMRNNDNLIIMVKSHTDNKGSDAYNMELSDRRAKSTVQYVISKGISSSRISGKGYGESEPKVDCKENCTPEQDAINRRSEFLIVK